MPQMDSFPGKQLVNFAIKVKDASARTFCVSPATSDIIKPVYSFSAVIFLYCLIMVNIVILQI
jgi:hypothetical protein